jgi:uncharacterized protein (DUF736 family)
MPQIGTFARDEHGVFYGTIRTVVLTVETVIRPSEKESGKAPDYRVFAGPLEFGAAWEKTSRKNQVYLSVKLDDPSFAAPIYASLMESEDGGHRLIWSR